MARFYAMIIIVECRHKLACPGLRWLMFSDEPNRLVSKVGARRSRRLLTLVRDKSDLNLPFALHYLTDNNPFKGVPS